MLTLKIIIASTRPGRVGPTVARWFHDAAVKTNTFDVELVDLAEYDLPVYDEPMHPMLKQYEHEHTRKWSEKVNEADAFVLVTPEYNFGPTPALLNALNYLYQEWNYKPVGFVSYGGISAGLRGVQMTKLTVTTLKMVPIYDGVPIPFPWKQLDDEGNFVANETNEKSAAVMLAELLKWAEALKPMRSA